MRMTFEQLCEMEPRLRELESEAKTLRPNSRSKPVCESVWLRLKKRLEKLVGFSRGDVPSDHPLASDGAYTVAVKHLTSILGI